MPKNLYRILILALVMASANMAQAVSTSGTRFPKARDVELGYEYNALFKRPLADDYGSLKNQDHFYTVSFGVCDWFVLDGKIGFGDVTVSGGRLPKLEFGAGFAGGYGFRIKAFEYERWRLRLITGFQHISVHPPARSIDDDKYEPCHDDWQVSAVVAKDFRLATAYAGMKGSDGEIVYRVNKQDKKRRYSKYHIGLITGLEVFLFDKKARLNLEGRFFDETALSASASWAF